MNKEYIKISEYAKLMSLNTRTVYRYYHNGKIDGYQDKDTGTIFISNPFKNKELNISQNRVVLYARVSSSENKSNLDSQLERLRLFACAKGYQIVKEIKEIDGSLDDNRPKLNELLEKDLNSFNILLVEHKDRLTRFGFNYIDILLKTHNKKLEVINLADNDKENLIQDFTSIIESFYDQIYGQNISNRKLKQLIKELNDSQESS